MSDTFRHIAPEVVFQNTTTSYKFFWSIALIKLYKLTGITVYDCSNVIIRMLCEAFFVLNNNRLVLGSADNLRNSIKSFKKRYLHGFDSADELYSKLVKDKADSQIKKT